jgi:hypothetical protein
MSVVEVLRSELGQNWIPAIYKAKIRSTRTRRYAFDIPQRENETSIQNSLFGIELQIGKTRVACPEIETARFLSVFARIGCREIAVPYDFTKIAAVADELESAWAQMLLMLNEKTRDGSAQARGKIRAGLLREIRKEIAEIGAGSMKPEFLAKTKKHT